MKLTHIHRLTALGLAVGMTAALTACGKGKDEAAASTAETAATSDTAATGETADVSFTIDSKDLVRTLSIVQRFRVQYPNVRPSVSSGCCKIQLYGEEMRACPGVAAQAFRLVSEQTGDIRLITTSEVDISILIAEHDLPAVLENLRAFFQV